MIGVLLNVPGRVQALLARLTATRGANLDNLNAPLSTIAPASSALSTAVWTNAHADALIAGGSGVSKCVEYTATGAFTFNVPANVGVVYVTLQAGGGNGGRGTNNGGGGGSGELLWRYAYAVTPGGTVAGTIGTNTQNSTFGTLTAQAGSNGANSSNGGKGGGNYGGATGGPGAAGSEFMEILGGSGGGSANGKGGDCGQNVGGAGSSVCGGGAASWYAAGAPANDTVQPTKAGVGAGGGGVPNSGPAAAGQGGNGYCLVEWIG